MLIKMLPTCKAEIGADLAASTVEIWCKTAIFAAIFIMAYTWAIIANFAMRPIFSKKKEGLLSVEGTVVAFLFLVGALPWKGTSNSCDFEGRLW